jgi:hypothetical protein
LSSELSREKKGREKTCGAHLVLSPDGLIAALGDKIELALSKEKKC